MIESCNAFDEKRARPCGALLVEQDGFLQCQLHSIHVTKCEVCGNDLIWRSQTAPLCESSVCVARRQKEAEEIAALEKELESLKNQYRHDLAEQIALEKLAGVTQ